MADFVVEYVADFKSEPVADFIPEQVADLLRNQHSLCSDRARSTGPASPLDTQKGVLG